jgi:tryptophan synthase beta chain
MEDTRVYLSDKEMPRQWYNIQADLPKPLPPPLHPGTLKPLGPQDLAPIFPMGLIEQEVSQQRWIDIPEEEIGRLCVSGGKDPGGTEGSAEGLEESPRSGE